jgi:hypothetical protein
MWGLILPEAMAVRACKASLAAKCKGRERIAGGEGFGELTL